MSGRRGKQRPAVGEHHDGNFGIYFAHKAAKLKEQFTGAQAADANRKSSIFQGVVVYFNGRLNPPEGTLKAMLGAHGGVHEQYLNRTHVTHVVADNLPDGTIKRELELKLTHRMTYVRPAWLVDSLKAGRRLPEAPYILDCFREPESRATAAHFFAGRQTAAPSSMNQAPSMREEPLTIAAAPVRSPAASIDIGADSPSGQPPDGGAAKGTTAQQLLHGDADMDTHADSRSAAGGPFSLQAVLNDPSGVPSSAAVAPSGQPSSVNVAPPASTASPAPAFYGSTRNAGNDPGFMASYFSSSRLHFIGSARAHVTALVAAEKQRVWGGGGGAVPAASGGAPHVDAETAAAGAVRDIDEGDGDGGNGQAGWSEFTGGGDMGDDDDEGGSEEDGGEDGLGRRGFSSATASMRATAAAGAPSSSAPPFSSVTTGGPRVVVHVDIDCFFAQVALLSAPHLKDTPVVVAHEGPRPSGTSARGAFGDGVDTSYREGARRPAGGGAGAGTSMMVAGMTAALDSSGASLAPAEAASFSALPSSEAAGADAEDSGGGSGSNTSTPTRAAATSALLARGREDNKSHPAYASEHRGGEVSSANYPARAFGIHAGMSVSDARARCPGLSVLPYDFPRITAVSAEVFRRFAGLTPLVLPVSCDEAYLDLSHLATGGGLGANAPSLSPAASVSAAAGSVTGSGPSGCAPTSVVDAVSRLRADIFAATGVTVSAGIAPNMMLARMATARAKPNGLMVLPQDSAAIGAFLASADVTDLPGVGWATGRELAARGVTTVGQLAAVPSSQLREWFGPVKGEEMWRYARGRDERPVVTWKPRQSVGVETNWGIRFSSLQQVHGFIAKLGAELAQRMAAAGVEAATMAGLTDASSAGPVRGRQLTLKVMQRLPDAPNPLKFMGHGACDSFSRSVRLPAPTRDAAALTTAAIRLYDALGCPPSELRGIGVQVRELSHRALHAAGAQAAAASGQGLLDGFLRPGATTSASGSANTSAVTATQLRSSPGVPYRDGAGGDGPPPAKRARKSLQVHFQQQQLALQQKQQQHETSVIDLLDDDDDEDEGGGDGGEGLEAATAAFGANGYRQSRAVAHPAPAVRSGYVSEGDELGGGEASRSSFTSRTSTVSIDLTDGDGDSEGREEDMEMERGDRGGGSAAAREAGHSESADADSDVEMVDQTPDPLSARKPAKRAFKASATAPPVPAGAAAARRKPAPQQQQLTLSRAKPATLSSAQLLSELRALGVDAAPFKGLPAGDLQDIVSSMRSRQARTVAAITTAAVAATGRGAAAAHTARSSPTRQQHNVATNSSSNQQMQQSASSGWHGNQLTAAGSRVPLQHGSPTIASSSGSPDVTVINLLDCSQASSSASASDTVTAARPGARALEAVQARKPGAALASVPPAAGSRAAALSAGVAAFAPSPHADVAASLRAWMVSIGPHPAPLHARLLAAYAVDRVTGYAGEEAAQLVRCLARFCDAIDAERQRALADPERDPDLVREWGAAGAGAATWSDVLHHVNSAVQEAAEATHGHGLDLQL